MADTKVMEQEFVVRVPQREENKKYHVMKFRAKLNQDFIMWTGSRMVKKLGIVRKKYDSNAQP